MNGWEIIRGGDRCRRRRRGFRGVASVVRARAASSSSKPSPLYRDDKRSCTSSGGSSARFVKVQHVFNEGADRGP